MFSDLEIRKHYYEEILRKQSLCVQHRSQLTQEAITLLGMRDGPLDAQSNVKLVDRSEENSGKVPISFLFLG